MAWTIQEIIAERHNLKPRGFPETLWRYLRDHDNELCEAATPGPRSSEAAIGGDHETSKRPRI